MKSHNLLIISIAIFAIPSVIFTMHINSHNLLGKATSIKDLHNKGTGTYYPKLKVAKVCSRYENVIPVPVTEINPTFNTEQEKKGYYPFGTSLGLVYYGKPQASFTTPKTQGSVIKDQYGMGSGTYHANTHTAVICSSYSNVISVPSNIPSQFTIDYERSGYFPFGKSIDGTTIYYGKPHLTSKKTMKRY